MLELALCLGEGSAGHRQLAIHDGRKALSSVGLRSLYEALDKTSPSGIGVPRVGSAGEVEGFGKPHRNPATRRHDA